MSAAFDFTDTGSFANVLLGETISAHQFAGNDTDSRSAGEANGLTRALCLMIDPALYDGSAYGLLRGNRVWRVLWDNVSGAIAGAVAADFALARGTAPPIEAVYAMQNLLATWPTLRDAEIGTVR
jgi:hypothetical protein